MLASLSESELMDLGYTRVVGLNDGVLAKKELNSYIDNHQERRISNADDFSAKLAEIPLLDHGREHRSCKLLEMDMPKNIRPLDLLYYFYWEQKNFLNFNEFYDIYRSYYQEELKEFQEKIGLHPESFNKGLKARIYRSWASILTQIHLGVTLSDIFGAEAVTMNTELDQSNCDIKLKIEDEYINIQVKKESYSKERRLRPKGKKVMEGKLINFTYKLFSSDVIVNPLKINGEARKETIRFKRNKKVDMLENGFTIFKKSYAQEKVLKNI